MLFGNKNLASQSYRVALLTCSVFSSFDRMLTCDGQMDRQTAYTALA